MSQSSIAVSVQSASFLKSTIQVLFASLLLAISAQFSFVLPFSPVPVSFQTFALFLIAAGLGPQKAFYAVLAYIAEGAAGLPFFAHGAAGPLVLIGPRGGYLVGFALAAFISGSIAQSAKGLISYSLAFLAGNLAIYALGFTWLAFWMGMPQAFAAGVLPFLLGDAAKILSAAAIMKGTRLIRG
jgi:biotin transport system substrate-specific component